MIFRIRQVYSRKWRIDFEESIASGGLDWDLVGPILDGERPIQEYEEVRLLTPNPDPGAWDYYFSSGTLGIMSPRAVAAFGSSVLRLFDLLPAKINDADFFLLKSREHLLCFDRESSEIEPFPGKPDTIMMIHRYAFKTDGILDPLLFTVPEVPVRLFGTQGVPDIIARNKLKGFEVKRLV